VERRLALLRAEIDSADRDADVRPEPGPTAGPEGRPASRVRSVTGEQPADAPGVEEGPAGPAWPVVPVPGRHAARRPGARARDLLDATLPTSLRGRVQVGPAQLTVVALVLAAGLAVTCWWLVHSRPDELRAPQIEPGAVASTSAPAVGDASPVSATQEAAPTAVPTTTTTSSGPGALNAAAPPTAAGAGSVTVDVAGKVRRPGIVVLDAGARVADAIDAAGGARRGVDLTPLNLARVLVDGEQVLVGSAAAGGATAPPGPGAASSGAAPGPGAPVDLNTATEPELEALPEVGPVTAQSILTWRDQHGRFSSVDELLEVDGIGDATLAKLTPYVTV
jgi:competence protein ComEA